MRNGILGAALCAPLMGMLAFTSMSFANESVGNESANKVAACAGSPDAITSLPEPLNRWAQVRCTPVGYVITGREGWLWIQPTYKALVVIPSSSPQQPDGSAYFTKIELTKVRGEEFERAYEVFHTGFDPKDAKPAGYRLDVTTMDGTEIRLYMFDYFTYGWGMACSKDACDASSRFVMLNMHQDPQPLDQPI
jgi:hypothetical protein